MPSRIIRRTILSGLTVATCAIGLPVNVVFNIAGATVAPSAPTVAFYNDQLTGEIIGVRATGTRPLGQAIGDTPSSAEPAIGEMVSSYLAPGARADSIRVDQRSSTDPRLSHFTQVIDGVAVFGSWVVAQTDGLGNVRALQGAVSTAASANPSVLTAAQALAISRAGALVTSAIGVIYDPTVLNEDGDIVSAWDIHTESPSSGAREHLIVSAVDGRILRTLDTPIYAQNRTICEGGATRPYLLVPEPLNWLLYQSCDGETVVSGLGWTRKVARTEGGAPSPQAHVNRIYDYLGVADSYLRTNFARDSWDGAGARTYVTADVHTKCAPSPAPGCPLSNAFWDPEEQEWSFGHDLDTDDIVAHEYMHAVTDATSHIGSVGESAELQETISDLYSEVIDRQIVDDFDGTANQWLIGEGVPTSTGLRIPLRNMANPPAIDNAPDYYNSPAYIVNREPHLRAGVGNKTFFLMADGGTFRGVSVTGIGLEKTFRILYGALSRLGVGAGYSQLGLAINLECDALVSQGVLTSNQCTNVALATSATNIYRIPAQGTVAAKQVSIADPRVGRGTDCDTGGSYATPLTEGAVRRVRIVGVGGVPAGVDSVVLGFTATNTTEGAHFAIWGADLPGGPPAARPGISSLAWHKGETLSGSTIVRPDRDGCVSMYIQFGQANLILETQGYRATSSTALSGTTVSRPIRVMDTRITTLTGGQPKVAGVTIDGVSVPSDAKFAWVSVTGVGQQYGTSVALGAYRSGVPRSGVDPFSTTNVNLPAGGLAATNLALVPIGDGGRIEVRTSLSSARIAIDVLAYSNSASQATLELIRPVRTWASFGCGGTIVCVPTLTTAARKLTLPSTTPIPVGAKAIVVSLMTDSPTNATHWTAWSGVGSVPNASQGQTRLNRPLHSVAIIPLDGRSFSIRAGTGTTHYLVDVLGYVK